MGARSSKKLPSPNKCILQHLADNVLLFFPKKKGKCLPFILLKENTPFARFCLLAEHNFELLSEIGGSKPPFLYKYDEPVRESNQNFVSSSDDDNDDDDRLAVDPESGYRQQIQLDVFSSDSEREEAGIREFSNALLSPIDTIETSERQGNWFFVTELSLWFSYSAYITFQRLNEAEKQQSDPQWKTKHAAEANEWFLKTDQLRATVGLFMDDLAANGQITSSVQEIRVLLQELNEEEKIIFFKK